MRLPLFLVLAVLMFLSHSATVSAQAIGQPGQLGASFQLEQAERVAPYSAAIAPKVSVAQVDDSHDRSVDRLWIASMISAIAGTSLDAASSWGLREGNGLLASPNGQFGGKGLALKAGLTAGILIPQLCLRKHRDLKRAFIVGNFAQAALFTGVSVHNFQVRNAQ
jgi:hypothetical protein